MEVVHRGRRRNQLVTIETFGQDGRGLGLKGPTAARAILLRQPVEDTCRLHRATFDDSPTGRPLSLQERVAVGAAGTYEGYDVDDPLGLTRIKGLTPRPWVPRLCTFPLEGLRERGIGLDRQFGGRGGRAEKALCSLPLLVAELLPKALECLGEPIDLPLFLQTFCAPIQGHHCSRCGTGCEAPGWSWHDPRVMGERG